MADTNPEKYAYLKDDGMMSPAREEGKVLPDDGMGPVDHGIDVDGMMSHAREEGTSLPDDGMGPADHGVDEDGMMSSARAQGGDLPDDCMDACHLNGRC